MSDCSQLALNTCRHDLYLMFFGVGILTVCCVIPPVPIAQPRVPQATAGLLQSRHVQQEPPFHNNSLYPYLSNCFSYFVFVFQHMGFYVSNHIAYLYGGPFNGNEDHNSQSVD